MDFSSFLAVSAHIFDRMLHYIHCIDLLSLPSCIYAALHLFAFQGWKDNDAIWRKIVQRNLINPKDKKKKKNTFGPGLISDLSEDEDEDGETSGAEDAPRRESEE